MMEGEYRLRDATIYNANICRAVLRVYIGSYCSTQFRQYQVPYAKSPCRPMWRDEDASLMADGWF